MKDSYICRNYRSDDEYQIVSLYRLVNNREMSLDYWRWQYLKNPFGKPLIKQLYSGDELIGHRGAIPIEVVVRSRPVSAALILNTYTHPDYRHQGISTYLASELYEEARRRGIKFIYNFPNQNSYPLYCKIAGWKTLDRRSMWQKEIDNVPDAGALKESNVVQVERFTDGVNLLWDKLKANYDVIVPRKAEFLNWRFVDNPNVAYLKYIVRDNIDNVLGYMILKVYPTADEVEGHIIDMLCVEDSDMIMKLLDFCYGYFIEKGIKQLSCWMPEDSFYGRILRQVGFIRRETMTHFGLKVLDTEDALLQPVEDINNWYLTMGDSDVF